MRHHWSLDPTITYLNHGSFGACPRRVLEAQRLLRDRIEREPVDFYARDWWDLVRDARETVAAFIDAEPEGLVFVRNATEGINTVLRSLTFEPGDELLVTDHAYRACRFALDWVAARAGARVVTVAVPLAGISSESVTEAVMAAVTSRTRFALMDHVSSETGLIMPIERIVRGLQERGVPTLVDGAHAPGMVPMELSGFRPAWYVANCHKWMCGPKSAGVLYIDEAYRDAVVPLSISHGRAMKLPEGMSRLHAEFDWPGTIDPTPWLCVPEAIEFMGEQLSGGWEAVRNRNRSIARYGRDRLCAALGIAQPAPDLMLGAMSSIPLPLGPDQGFEALHTRLRTEFQIEVPIVASPTCPQPLLRISAQLYNRHADYDRLVQALEQCLC
jgi:isopenicillin-N epimerase